MIPGASSRTLNPYLLGGKIKVLPEDFTVSEVIKKGIDFENGKHLLGVVEKKGVDHSVVVRLLGGSANYLGIKDKDALAYFFVSFKRVKVNGFSSEGVKLRIVGKTRKMLGRRMLVGNAFRINIKSCQCNPAAFEYWKNIMKAWQVPNYYGPQRFASNNLKIGQAIVNRNFSEADELIVADGHRGLKKAPLWLKKFYVQSYQSYLFNREIAKVIDGEITGESKMIEIMEPPVFKGNTDAGYLAGYGFRDFGDKYSKSLIEVAREEGIKFRHFYIDEMPELSQEGGIRPAGLPASLVSYTIDDKNDSATVRFVLNRGSYATVALRELLIENT
ncbi:MAG: tRNA pseudouridine(13) synthase TruD [Thaumarchaeota archaeon]|jgi:tRNA pseudouridine13 synthase|nr:tRNA pseudouridine(13) synthase TruD [Nitrososphaerota archaeon]